MIHRCIAPHPDPKRKGQHCRSPLLAGPRSWQLELVALTTRMPENSEGALYATCARCGAVSVFVARIPCGHIA